MLCINKWSKYPLYNYSVSVGGVNNSMEIQSVWKGRDKDKCGVHTIYLVSWDKGIKRGLSRLSWTSLFFHSFYNLYNEVSRESCWLLLSTISTSYNISHKDLISVVWNSVLLQCQVFNLLCCLSVLFKMIIIKNPMLMIIV